LLPPRTTPCLHIDKRGWKVEFTATAKARHRLHMFKRTLSKHHAEGTFKILREPRYVQGKVKDGYYPYRVIIDFPTDAALSPPSNLKELRDRIDTESKAWLAMLDQLGPKG
jgi:hypothetical protein